MAEHAPLTRSRRGGRWQLSENRNLEKVFKVLFSSEGSEIYIRSMTDYIKLGSTVDFYTVLETAAQRGETAIGYRWDTVSM